MAERQWNTEQLLYKSTEQITLTPQQEQVISINSIKSDAKALLVEVDFLQSSATAYNFSTRGFANLEVVYKNTSLKRENYFINFNRDVEVSDGVFKNTCILELVGNDIESITLKLFNKSEENLTINSLLVIPSLDLTPTQLASVLQIETANADIIHANGAVFSEAIFTQVFMTNILSKIDRNSKAGDVVDTIEIKDGTQGYYTETLLEETEQLVIELAIAGQPKQVPVWYALIEGEDAYKYYTTKNPKELYPEMSDSRVEEFKVKVRKSKRSKKASYEFALDELGNTTPTIILGAGTSTDENSKAGKAFIYKNSNGLYIVYVKQDGSTTFGMVIDDDGISLEGLKKKYIDYIEWVPDGVRHKFVGEEEQTFEYVLNEEDKIKGFIQNGVHYADLRVSDRRIRN